MSTILTILGVAFLIIFACLLVLILPYVMYFHLHSCKRCNHIMEYKGLKENGKEGYYLFHCPKCGAWEQIPKDVLSQDFIDRMLNPYKN